MQDKTRAEGSEEGKYPELSEKGLSQGHMAPRGYRIMYGQRIHEVLHFVQVAEYIGAVHPGRAREIEGCL